MRVLSAAVSAAAIALCTASPAAAEINGTALTSSQPAPSNAPVNVADAPKLTLENAKPLAIPPRPDVNAPKAPSAPPRFKAPTVLTAPELPQISVGVTPAPPPPPVGAPPVQTATKPSAPPPAETAPSQAKSPTPSAPPAAPKTQTAALPPNQPPAAAAVPKLAPLSVVFNHTATNLPDSAEKTLADIAERMRSNELLRLQLRSFAGGTPETVREARQLSLARALSVRERLGAAGIASTRIDIRALGIESGGGPPDRIDLELLNQ
jgi:Outer membrane protein and related peptidoglycan-associated (lipo)proteins